MEYRTLVIDAQAQPVKIINWQKAVCYVISERAIVLQEYENFTVRSVNFKMKVPRVLQVNNVAKKKVYAVHLSKINIHKRDNFLCAYCGEHFKKDALTIDHIIPICQGGVKKSWDNLISACHPCNNKKGGLTPAQANMPLLFNPLTPKWSPKKNFHLNNEELELWSMFLW